MTTDKSNSESRPRQFRVSLLRHDADEVQKALTALPLPLEGEYVSVLMNPHMVVEFDPALEGFLLEGFGIIGVDKSQSYTGPQMTYDKLFIQLWRQRIFHNPGSLWNQALSPLYPDKPFLEAIWHPDAGLRITMGGLESVKTQAEIIATWRGIKLFQKPVRHGRQLGERIFSDEKLLSSAKECYKKFFDKHGKAPTVEQLADRIGISRANLYRRLNESGTSMETIRTDALRDSREDKPQSN